MRIYAHQRTDFVQGNSIPLYFAMNIRGLGPTRIGPCFELDLRRLKEFGVSNWQIVDTSSGKRMLVNFDAVEKVHEMPEGCKLDFRKPGEPTLMIAQDFSVIFSWLLNE